MLDRRHGFRGTARPGSARTCSETSRRRHVGEADRPDAWREAARRRTAGPRRRRGGHVGVVGSRPGRLLGESGVELWAHCPEPSGVARHRGPGPGSRGYGRGARRSSPQDKPRLSVRLPRRHALSWPQERARAAHPHRPRPAQVRRCTSRLSRRPAARFERRWSWRGTWCTGASRRLVSSASNRTRTSRTRPITSVTGMARALSRSGRTVPRST